MLQKPLNSAPVTNNVNASVFFSLEPSIDESDQATLLLEGFKLIQFYPILPF